MQETSGYYLPFWEPLVDHFFGILQMITKLFADMREL